MTAEAFLDAAVTRVAGQVTAALAAQGAEPFDPAVLQARRGAFGQARQGVTTARATALTALRTVDSERAALDAVQAGGRLADVPAAEARLSAATAAAGAARRRLSEARATLAAAHAAMATANGTASSPGRLSRVPVALLPVRLETRWFALDAARYELRVRVFPDAVHVDAHQPLMTAAEQVTATEYWRTRQVAGPEALETLAAWHRLCEAVGEPRAGWLVAQLDPAGLDGRVQPPGAAPPGDIPRPPTAPEGWADPVTVRCLPDRWAVTGYSRGQRVLLHWGSPVSPELPLSLDDAADPGPSGRLDAGVRWLTEFSTAEAAGMAMRIPVEKTIARHLDRLLVFGVAAAEDAPTATSRLAGLLAAHAATGAGLPGVGTPTNNTEAARSAWRGRPLDHAAAHRQLTSLLLNRGGTRDAELVARALAVDPVLLRRLPGADRRSQDGADQMHRVLWYATGQRLLQEQVESTVAEADIAFVRDHVIGRVRARGPLPPIRIEDQPYGLLPVVSLDRWVGTSAEARMRMVVNVLRTLRGGMLRFLDAPDHLSTASDTQGGLLRSLSVQPWTTVGDAMSKTFGTQLEADASRQAMRAWWDAVIPQLRQGPVDLAVEHGGIRVFRRQNNRTTSRYATARPLVAADADPSTPLPAAGNYLTHLGGGRLTTAQVRAHQVNGAAGRSLLYLLLREAYESLPTFDQERDHLFRQALRELGERPAGELESLATDVMDVWSNRLDAWATSVATERLDALASATGHRVHLGGFGWVEQLVPPGEGVVAGGGVRDDPDSAGYLHLPSASQARTAAVLRGAFESHSGTGPGNEAFRLDLRSSRVRAARALLAGLREGQSLGALLGYRLERRMVERGLGEHVPALRRVATAATGPTDPADSTHDHPARDPATTETADGVVVTFLLGASTLQPRLEAQGVPHEDAFGIVTLAHELDDAVDGLSDLLVAEGVHGALSGNASRAAAAFDLMAEGGGAAPDPLVTATPATGVQLGLRVAVALPATAHAPGWPGDDGRVRAVAEPRLNAWAAAALGSPDGIGFRATGRASDGSVSVQTRTLADVDLSPLDVVALAAAAPAASPLLRLLGHRLAAGLPAGTEVTVDPEDPGPSPLSLADALVVAHTLQRLFAAARPLRAADLGLDPDDRASAVDDAELAGRAERVRPLVVALAGALDTATGVDAWWRSAVLLGVADPAQAATIIGWRAELGRRLAAPTAADDPLGRLGRLAGAGLPVLPVFTPANAGELRAAFGSAQRQAAATDGDPTGPARWLHDTARVRPPVDALDRHVTLAAALDAPVPLLVAHLPLADGPWAGERMTVAGPRVALLAAAPLPVDLGAPLAGLLVDTWTETMPIDTVTTGLAFSYDAPKPQAPQAILLAVPANRGAPWRFEDLEATLLETLGMARLRLQFPYSDDVAALGDYLPALYLRDDHRSDLEVP